MPQPRKQTAASTTPKSFERRIQLGGGAGFTRRVPGPDGRLVEVTEQAAFGDLVVLDALEQMRLDSLGALAPAGATREDVQAEFDQRVAAYRGARSNVAAVD